MENNKSKWESKYEEFKNGNMSKELETMKEKIKDEANKFNEAIKNGKNDEAKKAQDEINKLQGEIKKKEAINTSVKFNSSKIENILQLKKDLVKDSVELLNKKSEIDQYQEAEQTIKDKDADIMTLNTDMEAINAKIKQVDKQLENIQLSPADREKLEKDKEKLKAEKSAKAKEIGDNNNDYSNALNKREGLADKVSKYNINDIDIALAQNEKLIAKCDMVGKNLLNGKNMEEINASLKKFKFTPNKDFAKKVTTMRSVYEKEENEAVNTVKEAVEEAKKAEENAKNALEKAKKAEEEYKKISNLPVPKTNLWQKAINGLANIFKKGGNKKDVKTQVEEAKKEAEEAKKEAEKAAKEYKAKVEEAKKIKSTLNKEGERSTDYLEELRKQKDENVVLEGMTLYGDTFKDRLKFNMPNISSSISQGEIDDAKSKNNYVMQNETYVNSKGETVTRNDHQKDKRAYNADARKAEIKKNIEELKALKAKKDDGNER